VRPDGIVAWASGERPDIRALQAAADRWYRRPPAS
jgi:hypothetical protein